MSLLLHTLSSALSCSTSSASSGSSCGGEGAKSLSALNPLILWELEVFGLDTVVGPDERGPDDDEELAESGFRLGRTRTRFLFFRDIFNVSENSKTM